MAVTNYHTIGGHILSEHTGGIGTECVQDAHGTTIHTTRRGKFKTMLL
jgi:hypothetical protein